MTDESLQTPAEATTEGWATHPPGVPQTGNAAVDAVLAEVVAVAAQPVTEHVAAFERAHEQLRAALDPTEA